METPNPPPQQTKALVIRNETIERVTKFLGPRFQFKQRPESGLDETIEAFVLDPLALDRQIALAKASKEGKPIIKTAATAAAAVRPVYVPSKSEKLSSHDYNALMMRTFPEYEVLKPGDVSKEGATFVAWDLAQRYPSSYIGKTNRPKALPFFEAMTEEQTWDFFYVYNPRALDLPPFIFVPTEQFEHFLNVVNASIQTKLTIPPGKPSEKFYVAFGSSCTVRPKYIGRSSSHNEYQALQGAIPPPDNEDACEDATVHGLEMLLANLTVHKERDAAKTKSKKRKQEKAQNRDESIYDVQLFLGLRPLASVAEGKDKKVVLDQPVPHALEKDVVFICFDIEVAEEHHGTILEVGIMTLDTRDIIGIPPGEAGRNWFPHIKSRHLITEDYKYMRNRKFVVGCPERFNFGESEYPKASELRQKILSAFEELSVSGIPEKENRYRHVVLVGHDLNSDLNYMASMDVHPWSVGGMNRCIDTKDMHQSWRKGDQGRALGYVLQDLDIPFQNLHNAGNDAAYTMRAMLGLAVCARVDEEKVAKKPKKT